VALARCQWSNKQLGGLFGPDASGPVFFMANISGNIALNSFMLRWQN